MKLLEIFTQTPLAGAVGWTVLHSLWQGAFVSALLGIVLLAVRSPRFRYTAACIAMVTMIGAFGVTLVHLLPASHESLWKAQTPALRIGRAAIAMDTSSSFNRDIAAIVPWLAPLWLVGVLLFYARYLAGVLSVRRLRSRGVCSPPSNGRNSLRA